MVVNLIACYRRKRVGVLAEEKMDEGRWIRD